LKANVVEQNFAIDSIEIGVSSFLALLSFIFGLPRGSLSGFQLGHPPNG
jgi:hypothetical protein